MNTNRSETSVPQTHCELDEQQAFGHIGSFLFILHVFSSITPIMLYSVRQW